MVFNFRGYCFNQGKVSISSQVADSVKVIEFVRLMSRDNIFNIKDINILSYDFGAYIALILSSKIKIINRLLMLSPIIDLERHINHIDFAKSLHYINRFLPGYIKGIEDVAGFIKMTRNELKNPEYQIIKVLKKLNYKKLRVIVGDKDKITPIDEIKDIVQKNVDNLEYVIIKNMSHDSFQEDYDVKIIEEIKKFFF
jgi:pimeloyl-ACP methyl ester carboxylesterase